MPVDPGPNPPLPPPKKSVQKSDFIKTITIMTSILFVIAMCFYNLSFTGLFGLQKHGWDIVWVICQNGLPLCLVLLSGQLMPGFVRSFLYLIFIPYFITRFLFDFTTYLQVYIFSKEAWQFIFIIELVTFVIIALILNLKLLKDKNGRRN